MTTEGGDARPFIKPPNRDEIVAPSFPEGKREKLTIGGKTPQELLDLLKIRKKLIVDDPALDWMKSPDFTTSDREREIELVILTAEDMGLPPEPRTKQLLKRAKELGLALCPAEVAPHLALGDQDRHIDTSLKIVMNPVSTSTGVSEILTLSRYDNILWLGSSWAGQFDKQFPGSEFVFKVPSGDEAQRELEQIRKPRHWKLHGGIR